MNIGEVSQKSGVNSKMIRRYEEEGIIPKAGRSLAGYRTYSENDVHILRFVKRSREMGFSMKDTKLLLSLWRNKSRTSAQVKSIAQKHIKELQVKLQEIQGMLGALETLSNCCHGDERADCPILEDLGKV